MTTITIPWEEYVALRRCWYAVRSEHDNIFLREVQAEFEKGNIDAKLWNGFAWLMSRRGDAQKACEGISLTSHALKAPVAEDAGYDRALRIWASRKTEIAPDQIADVRIEFTDGYALSEDTWESGGMEIVVIKADDRQVRVDAPPEFSFVTLVNELTAIGDEDQ